MKTYVIDGIAVTVSDTDYVARFPADPAPPGSFSDISDRQCFQQLAILGKITSSEALAAVTVGALPKTVTDGIAALPSDQQFAAQMLLCGATTFHRAHPMTSVFGSFFGMGSDDLDALWRAATLL